MEPRPLHKLHVLRKSSAYITFIFLLPPANEVCEGYIFTPVSHSVHKGRGWCLPQRMLGYPPGPEADTPPPFAVHAGRYGQQEGGMHPTRMYTCKIYYWIQVGVPGGLPLPLCVAKKWVGKFEGIPPLPRNPSLYRKNPKKYWGRRLTKSWSHLWKYEVELGNIINPHCAVICCS